MANVFIHFEPIGAVGDELNIDEDLPQYVLRGSEEEANWRRRFPGGYRLTGTSFTTGSTALHEIAFRGDVEEARSLLENDGLSFGECNDS